MQSSLKISWKSFHPFSHDVAKRHGFAWKHRKRNPVSKGLNLTPQKFSGFVLVSCSTDPENFMKIGSSVFPQSCWQTDKQTKNTEKETLCPKGSMQHPQILPVSFSYHAWPILKNSWKSVHPFSCNLADRQTKKKKKKQRWKHNLRRSA